MQKSLLWISLGLFSFSIIAFFYIIWMIQSSIQMDTLLDFFVIVASFSVYSIYLIIFFIIPLILSVIFLILGLAIPDNSEKSNYMRECRKDHERSECNEMWELNKM
jgi:hypothetical protein